MTAAPCQRLICAWTADHVAYLRMALREGDRVVSFDLDASALLNEAGIPFVEAYTFISDDETAAFQEPADELARTWYKPIESQCLIDGVSPLEMERRTLYTFFQNALCARLIGLRLFERFPCSRLVIFDYPRDPITFTDLHENATMPILEYLAERRGVDVEVISAPQTGPSRVPERPRRSLPRLLLNLLRNRLHWERQFWGMALRRGASINVVLLINEAERYARIVDHLRSRFPGRFFTGVIGGRSTAGVKIDGCDWHYPGFNLLPDLGYLRIRRLSRRWYAAWEAYRAAYQGAYPEIVANPHFDFQFRYLFGVRLVNTAQTYREGRTLFKRLRTHLLLTGGVPELNASGIIGAAADRRIPVLSLPHSGIPTEPNLTYFGDAAIAWTEDYRAVWKDAIEPEAIHVVGLDPAIIARGYPLRSDAARPERARKRVTVLTSTVQLSALSYVEIDAHRRMLAALAHVPAHLRDRVEVCFKLHPVYDYRYFYESLVKDDSPVQIIRDRSIESVLDETDLALLVNINTSAHLLALARAIPLLHIHNAASWFRAYDRLDDWGQDFTIRDADAVWPAIERALFDPAYRRAVVDANRAYWNRLKADQPDPAERIAAILSDRLS
jgi:hypothetical protein